MREYTVEELAQAVRSWCEKHGIAPANGQASEEISERTIRYYRTLGLLDAPLGSYVKTFGDKHRLQLIAIRVYQAQGLPLRKIREELYGKSLADLVAFEKSAARKGAQGLAASIPLAPAYGHESWSVTPLGRGFMLVSREHTHVPAAVLQQIQHLLAAVSPNREPSEPVNLN